MKPLELTEEQKNKILEMCKVLFPEDNFWWEYEMYGRGLKQDFNDVLCVEHTLEEPKKGWDNRPIKHEFFNIHWFEFCMGKLLCKIDVLYCEHHNIHNIEDREYHDKVWTGRPYFKAYSGFNCGNLKIDFHLVDYLYEEFKKLK